MEDALRQVLGVFAEELREQTSAISDALIRIERSKELDERRLLMKEIFRHAHSIKGNAGTLGLMDLEELAHAVETALTPFRSGERALVPSLAPAILQSLDQAQRRVEAAIGGSDAPDPLLAYSAAEILRLSSREEDPFGRPRGTRRVGTVDGAQAALAAEARPHAGRGAPVSGPPSLIAGPPTEVTAEPTPARNVPERRASDAVETIRVAVERLSALDRQFDDLREVKSALEHRIEEARRIAWTLEAALVGRFEGLDRELTKNVRQQIHLLHRGLSSDVTELTGRLTAADEELRALRMLPVETILAPLSRAVWEHARSVQKLARLEITGAQVALDRRLLQELKDPLVHLARNSVDHGVETAELRQLAGKPAEGVLRIDVEQRGAKVYIAFSDDGAGMDAARLRQTAVDRGLVTAEAAALLTDAQAHEFVFAPGFSTAATVSRTSGRGVGLDVVKENVQKVGGKVSLTTTRGRGTRFVLELPLTLATAQALLFESCGFVLALPLVAVARSKYLNAAKSQTDQIDVNGQLLTLHTLSQLLNLKDEGTSHPGCPVVVVKAADRLMAIRVDRLLGEREVVVRPIPPEIAKLRHISAAASLGDGRLVWILSPRALGEAAQDVRSPEKPKGFKIRPRVVVADDSITTRSLHRQVLEAAGFEVATASDGEEALRILRAQGADLVVSDVRMPRLDGLGLTRRIRQELKLSRVPVVLVSSLDSEEDRLRAHEAGASAYLPKGAYERGELLKLVRALLQP